MNTNTVILTHTTLTNKCTLIIPCYVIEYSKLVRHVSIPCWDHHQGLLDYKLHNYKLTIKVHIKSIRCWKVKIVGYLWWFLGPLEINVKNIKLNMDINIHKHSKLCECIKTILSYINVQKTFYRRMEVAVATLYIPVYRKLLVYMWKAKIVLKLDR
jgi:hypothetical protein